MITGTDINGCSKTDTISLTVVQSISMSSNPLSPTVCEGESIQITVSGANTYIWSPATGLNSSIGNSVIADPLNSTNYQVIGTDNFGCSDTLIQPKVS